MISVNVIHLTNNVGSLRCKVKINICGLMIVNHSKSPTRIYKLPLHLLNANIHSNSHLVALIIDCLLMTYTTVSRIIL